MKQRRPVRKGAKKPIKKPRQKSIKETGKREPMPSRLFIMATEQFLSDIDVLSEAFRTVMPVLEDKDKQQTQDLKTATAELNRATEAIKKGLEKKKGKAQGRVHPKDVEAMRDSVLRLISAVRKLHRASNLYRQQALVLLVALLDDFTGEILGIAFKSKPDLLRGSDKTIPIEEAIAATSLDELVARIVASETDKILRLSYANQVEYLDKKFKLGLRENFTGYSDFIEVVERRHLFVHTGGRVSGQYLEACQSAGKCLTTKLGAKLAANDAYLTAAEELIFEYALRLSQALYRRLFPKDLNDADKVITDYGVHLLIEQRWQRALKLFSFAHDIPEKLVANEASRRVFLVNLAIALQGLGCEGEATTLLGEIDWSSCHPRFSIAVAALRRDYATAAVLMKRNRDAIEESDYRGWPAFREFRSSKEFQQAFNAVFGKPFIPEVPPQTQLPDAGSPPTWASQSPSIDTEQSPSVAGNDGK